MFSLVLVGALQRLRFLVGLGHCQLGFVMVVIWGCQRSLLSMAMAR